MQARHTAESTFKAENNGLNTMNALEPSYPKAPEGLLGFSV